MTFAPFWTAHWIARKIMSESPDPSEPSTLPISAFDTPRATPMRCPSTSRPKTVPAQCVPWPFPSPSPSPVKSCCTSSTPAKAGCVASMPVSSTATTAPAPVNVETSAPTAAMPHAGVARRPAPRPVRSGASASPAPSPPRSGLEAGPRVRHGRSRRPRPQVRAGRSRRASRSRRVDCRTDRRPRSAAGPSGRCTSPLPTPFRSCRREDRCRAVGGPRSRTASSSHDGLRRARPHVPVRFRSP